MSRFLATLSIGCFALTLAVAPTPEAAAQVPPPVTLDADVCSDEQIVIWYEPATLWWGQWYTDYLLSYFGESVTLVPLFDQAQICDPVSDPRELGAFYRIVGPFVNNSAEFYQSLLEAYLVDWYPLAQAVELDCQLSGQSLPEGLEDGWQHHNLDLDTALVAGWTPRIAVLDTGIDLTHPVFASNTFFDPLNWDYVDDDYLPEDTHGHGTAMAGAIASLAPDAELLIYRVLAGDGVGNWTGVAQALLAAGADGAEVANLSLGTPRQQPIFFQQALREVTDDACYDMVVVAAAGNSCANGYGCTDTFWPAADPDVISVMAYDNNGLFFRRGAGYGNDIDLAAPGVTVCTAWSQDADDAGPSPYRRLTGSSVAAAHASAVAGLLRYAKPYLDSEEVRDALQATALSPMEMVPYCWGKPFVLNACTALDLGGCVGDTKQLIGFDTNTACEAYAGPTPQWDYDPYSSSQAQSCPVDSNYEVWSSNQITPPVMGYCPESTRPPLTCTARVTSQPNRTPCPDCDADIWAAYDFMLLQLRLRSFNLGFVTDLVVRVNDGNATYAYPLDTAYLPTNTTSATMNYWVNVANGPNLASNELSVTLVTYFNINGTRSFTIDQLNVDMI